MSRRAGFGSSCDSRGVGATTVITPEPVNFVIVTDSFMVSPFGVKIEDPTPSAGSGRPSLRVYVLAESDPRSQSERFSGVSLARLDPGTAGS